MLATPHQFLVAIAAFASIFLASTASAQPGSWGGDRGSWGSRGPSSWGGDRGSSGWGGDRGSFYGGFRGPPGGGYPSGGFPFGGGNPSDMVRRADTNNNGTLEPDELQNGYGRPVRYMAERAGLNTSQPLRVDQVVAALDSSRSNSSNSGSASPSSASTAIAGSQGFAAQTQAALVPGFDNPPGAAGTGVGTTATSTAQSNQPLEQRFDERILERAKDRMKERDRNGNGVLDGEELADYRGDPPIMSSDTNHDGVISLEEMALRYQSRYGGGPGGYPGGPGGPPPWGGFPGGGFPGGGYPGGGYPGSSYTSSSTSGNSSTPKPPSSSSTTTSSSSSSHSSNDRAKEIAQFSLTRNDRNGSGKLEKDEWGGLRDNGKGVDTNKDDVITIDELAANVAMRMEKGDFGRSFGGDRGRDGGDRGRDGGDRYSGGDRGRDGGSDRGRDGGSDRGRFFFGGGPGGGPGGPGGFPGGGPGGFGGGPGGFGGPRDFSGGSGGGYPQPRSEGTGYSGSSTATEAAAPKTSYRTTTAAELLPKGLDSWFTRSDTDGDGQVSMSEYAAKWDAEVAKKFQQYDSNGDGFISADEALRGAPSARR